MLSSQQAKKSRCNQWELYNSDAFFCDAWGVNSAQHEESYPALRISIANTL